MLIVRACTRWCGVWGLPEKACSGLGMRSVRDVCWTNISSSHHLEASALADYDSTGVLSIVSLDAAGGG